MKLYKIEASGDFDLPLDVVSQVYDTQIEAHLACAVVNAKEIYGPMGDEALLDAFGGGAVVVEFEDEDL